MHAMHEIEEDELVALHDACEEYQFRRTTRDQAVITAYNAGHEVAKIIEASGLSRRTIYELLRRRGVALSRKTGPKGKKT
jgi:hypothetical protein